MGKNGEEKHSSEMAFVPQIKLQLTFKFFLIIFPLCCEALRSHHGKQPFQFLLKKIKPELGNTDAYTDNQAHSK